MENKIESNVPYLLFCKGTDTVSRLIKFFTWGKYSHVSFLYDNKVYESWYPNGVIINDIDNLPHYKNVKVDVYSIHMNFNNNDIKDLINFFISQYKKEYDLRGIFGFITRSKTQETDKWFCSELIAYAFDEVIKRKLLNVEPFKASPTLLSYSPYLKLNYNTIYKNNNFQLIK